MATNPNLQIGPKQHEALSELARANGKSASEVLNDAIEEYYTTRKPCTTGDSTCGFYDNPTLDELAEAQGTKPIREISELYADFWPADESADDFLDARRRWRQGG